MKYSVVTFGCRVNQADSLGFEEDLLARGAVAVAPDQADLVLVNTCSVTASADQGARQTIRRIARDNPAARIVVTGCYATRRPDEIASLPNVVRVVPNDDKPRLLPIIADDFDLTTAARYGQGDGACGAAIEPGLAGRTSFTLRVQTGCGEQCSVLHHPGHAGPAAEHAVGGDTRRSPADLGGWIQRDRADRRSPGSYGRDLSPASSLVALLRALEGRSARGVQFRISSLEPMDCSREIVELVADGCFAPHFHLPLQHASDGMLATMCRPYTIAYYEALVDFIRVRIPHASIGSDVIVGFPGETDGDFEQLLAYLERSPLTHVHVFPYSDRPGTAATSMSGKVPGAVVRERGRRVREVAARLAERFRQSQIGSVRPGLTLDDGSSVVTDNYLKLRIPAGRPRNERVRVLIRSPHEGELVA